jgi:hypothetical protein
MKAVLMKPTYDNRRVVHFPSWFLDNRRALIAWWWQCDLALRLRGEDPGDADFDAFCACQHEREAGRVFA